MTSAETEEADRRFTAWMRENLSDAAEHFNVTIVGEPVFGWRLRSISAPVHAPDGDRWLRVVSEQVQWAEGDWWTGNTDANAITGISKPRVLDVMEWEIPGVRRQRAELMTRMRGHLCSATDAITADLDLPTAWWDELRRSYNVLAATPTSRTNKDQTRVNERAREAFGDTTDLPVHRWETVHGDLHWNNLLQPRFGLLDWELWGTGPAGTDPATLYLYSLLVPTMSRTVHTVFRDVLDSPHGKVAQLHVTARLLLRLRMGDHPELEQPLREHTRRLLNK